MLAYFWRTAPRAGRAVAKFDREIKGLVPTVTGMLHTGKVSIGFGLGIINDFLKALEPEPRRPRICPSAALVPPD